MTQIVLNSPLDMHLHLRDKEMLEIVAPLSAAHFSAAVVMPNIAPPVKTTKDMVEYQKRVIAASKRDDFLPLMTLFLTEELDVQEIENAKENGLIGMKLYPLGITTGSEEGSSSILSTKNREIFACLSELEIPLMIHGETNGFVLDREREFVPIFEKICKEFPKLKVIAEHITTKEVAKAIKTIPNLYGTITVHHLEITLDDVIGGLLNPHNFCKPIAKTEADKEAILELALEAYEKVSFGSDSAPHPRANKECGNASAGIFTAPIALPFLADIFDRHGKLENLQKFVSDNAKSIYNLKNIPEKEIKLKKERYKIPSEYDGIVPFFAGGNLSWSVDEL